MPNQVGSFLQSHLKRLIQALPDPFNVIPTVCRDFKHFHGRYPNLIAPQTFSEKLQKRKLFDRRPVLTLVADKYAVRDYVARQATADILPKLYCATNDPSTIDLEILPNQFVVKPTHGSGWVRIVKDKPLISRDELVGQCFAWLRQSYYGVTREWAYKNIPPRIIIEEYLDDGTGKPPVDYKCFVFDGKVAAIQVDLDRFSGHKRNMYDVNWNKIEVRYKYDNYGGELPRPDTLDQIVSYAKMLGTGFDFIRADFYSIGNRVVFGELTTTPENGFGRFDPVSFDRYLGQLWNMRF